MTGWKPMPLMTLVDFCYKIDREAVDQFQYLKSISKFDSELKFEDMNEEQKKIYEEAV